MHAWLQQEPSLVSLPVDCTLKSGSVRQWSPLFVASNHLRDLRKVKALVEAGADLTNGDWGTHWPSEDYAINAYFIEQGIDVNQPSYLGFHGVSVMGMESFFLIAKVCYTYRALSGLEDEPIMGNEHFVQPVQKTPLHFAARLGNIKQVHLLIAHGANPALQTVSRLSDPRRMID